MKKSSLKILILNILLLAVLVVPGIVSANTEMVVKQKEEYIIYSDAIKGDNVSFAFSKTEIKNKEELSNIVSYKVRKDNASDRYVAYVDNTTMENVNEKGITYVYIKNLDTNEVTTETIDLTKALNKDYVESITRKIAVDTKQKNVEVKDINGVKTEITTGKIVITDKNSSKYSYIIQVLPKEGTNNYKELMKLAKQINAIANNEIEKEPSFMEKLKLMNDFYTLYEELKPEVNDNAWLPVQNMEIMQPNFDKAEDESEYDNQQYIVFIKNGEGLIDAQFMTCEARYNPLYEKETVTIKETSKLPVTFDSLTTIIIILAIIIVAIIIVLVIRKKASKKEENK